MTDSRFLNAVIGAVVTLVLSFTGFSPIIGGAVAAWLEEGDKSASIQVGALSGLLAVFPFLVLIAGLLVAPIDITVAIFGAVVVVAFIGAFFAGLGALGGYLAYYLVKDRRIPGTREQ